MLFLLRLSTIAHVAVPGRMAQANGKLDSEVRTLRGRGADLPMCGLRPRMPPSSVLYGAPWSLPSISLCMTKDLVNDVCDR